MNGHFALPIIILTTFSPYMSKSGLRSVHVLYDLWFYPVTRPLTQAAHYSAFQPLSLSFSSSSQDQVAPVWPPDHLGGPVRHRCGAEFLTHRLHTASQWELRPTADLSGAHRQRHLQVHGHLHHGVCGLHDWHVQPVLILPGSQIQPCLHHVSYCMPERVYYGMYSAVWLFFQTVVLSKYMYTFMSTCIFPYSILQSYSQKQAQWSWSIYIRIDCKSRRKDSYRHVTFIARHLP